MYASTAYTADDGANRSSRTNLQTGTILHLPRGRRDRAFGITGDWETMAVKAEDWVEAVTKGGRRFMAAWREEEEDAARHRQEKREATRLGKLQSYTEA